MDLVQGLLETAKQKGQIRPEADCRLIAVAFFSHYLNTLMMGLNQSVFTPDELVGLLGQMIDQLMAGVGAESI